MFYKSWRLLRLARNDNLLDMKFRERFNSSNREKGTIFLFNSGCYPNLAVQQSFEMAKASGNPLHRLSMCKRCSFHPR